MKKQIFEALKTKFPGVQDAILNRIADKLAKTVTKEEEVATSVEGVTFQQVLESYGDSRATEAQQTAVSTYEKKYNIKDGKPVEDPTQQQQQQQQQQNQQEEAPAWAKETLNTIKLLNERLEKIEGDKTTTTRKTHFDDAVKSLPEKLRARYEKDFSKMSFKDDDEFEAYIADLKTDVVEISGAVVEKKPSSSPMAATAVSSEKASPHVQQRVEARKAEPVVQAIQGLPNQTN